ncbi:hypothetical protein VTJ83DRAFT_2012 [Remersonia thermophila]|uniref:Autophagy-related protein 1 n=1 Tax=Remersonia thermophila TaxID=72144 RepID=A0ABR4DHK0_9PEZI
MDPDGDSQPTQATQPIFDPRRLGLQTSGFSDEDIADIICILLPYSDSARQEVRRIAAETTEHMVRREDVDGLPFDYTLEDDLRNFAALRSDVGDHHIALRFSSELKNPALGFTFGRVPNLCDICLLNGNRRVSKVHFRIFLNQWGVLMLEDMSTNGTMVDLVFLRRRDQNGAETRRTLESGSRIRIPINQGAGDVEFLVRIPNREGEGAEAYKRNLDAYLARQYDLAADANATIVPGPGGHVDIFQPAAAAPGARNHGAAARRADGGPSQARPRTDGLPRPWNGSNKYNRVCEIGRGAFATVYKVTMKLTGQPFAAKELDKRKFMKNNVLDQKVENEMQIMRKVKHPNIVEYIEHFDWDDRSLIIIMEYVSGGDLGKLVLENPALSESATKTIAAQLVDALGYLHDMNITHRDVKPDNILVHSLNPLVVKLTDFGLSKMVDNEQTFLRTFCGTLLYCAPEVYPGYAEYDEHGRRHQRNRYRRPVTGQRYGHAVDIWSLGGVLFYALTKMPPFPVRNGASHPELLTTIMTRPLDVSPLIKANVSDDCIDFISSMLNRRPERRATVDDLKNHPWISSSFTTVSRSFEEEAEEELRVTASQLSLEDNSRLDHDGRRELRVPSDDGITDDEDVDFDANGLLGYESEKENYTFGPNHQPRRLFGEVDPSAVRSTGAVPPDRLNLPASAESFDSTGMSEILGNDREIKDSFEPEDSLTPRQTPQKPPPGAGLASSYLSAGQSRSVEELNNMTFDVASQSLGGAESILENLNMKSRAVSLPRSHTTGDLTTSKRKPSCDSDAEDETPGQNAGRGLKRFRSAGSAKAAARKPIDSGEREIVAPRPSVPPPQSGRQMDNSEYVLLVQIPSIPQPQSGRQIDSPVHKSTYWSALDRRTWHLEYPEMTHLQLDAFKQAAMVRGEDFAPGKTPLWDLAMRYFPPTNCERVGRSVKEAQQGGLDPAAIPSTAKTGNSAPATPPNTDDPEPPSHMPAPLQSDPGRPVVAYLQPAPHSALPDDLCIAITESMVSWGRAFENTRSYPDKENKRVPLVAFKILLWKAGYDPAKNFRPWNRAAEPDEEQFRFYISTKATAGIHVNGAHLPSDDPKNPAAPSKHWMALHDGDTVTVSKAPGQPAAMSFVFRCLWGGSARSRRSLGQPYHAELVPAGVAARLDEVCGRAERKMRSLSEHDLKMEEANHDADERAKHVDRERQRSREFEQRRLEACRALRIRRLSPAPGVTLGEESASQTPWSSYVPGNRTVPALRHASPATLELLRGARRG